MSGAAIGITLGAVCLACLGGMVWLFNAAQDPREDFEPFDDERDWGGR
jgi:hypothetical protein